MPQRLVKFDDASLEKELSIQSAAQRAEILKALDITCNPDIWGWE